jgi:RNA polymerase sigma factor (sigma-70 family)
MALTSVPASIRRLTDQLPFGLDDTERAGRAFRRWRAAAGGEAETCAEPPPSADAEERTDAGKTDAKRTVDLWTYCFVRRYFLVKFAAQSDAPASDLDELVAQAYQKVENKRATVRRPERYPHWVSVVCKNTFINYLHRRRPASVSISEDDGPPLPVEGRADDSIGLAREVVTDAVARLPAYLQPVARLRFLEGRSYNEIQRETGTSVPTARSYAGRARKQLRDDPEVRALVDPPLPGENTP